MELEMIEVMKLSSALGLQSLLKVAEQQFQGHMLNFLDSNYTCLNLKPQLGNGGGPNAAEESKSHEEASRAASEAQP